MQSNAFAGGDLYVVDGDDLEWCDRRYRLAGYDAPEVTNLRSTMDTVLEKRRGQLSKLRLETLVASARSIYLIEWGRKLQSSDRQLATLLINGYDVSVIAIKEGWGVDYRKRNVVDWGDCTLPFFGMPILPKQ